MYYLYIRKFLQFSGFILKKLLGAYVAKVSGSKDPGSLDERLGAAARCAIYLDIFGEILVDLSKIKGSFSGFFGQF